MSKHKKYGTDLPKIFAIALCVILFIVSFFIQQKKRFLNEAKKLPVTNTNLELVNDGTYENTTTTSFMKLTLEVTVTNHQFTQIKIIENKGSYGKKADEIIAAMVQNNKVVNSLIKGDELGNIVFISCVDGALKKGIKTDEN